MEGITFLEGFVDVDLSRDKVLVILHVGEDAALVDPVVVVGAEEEDREVADIVAKALNVWWHQARVADLCWPPPAAERDIVYKEREEDEREKSGQRKSVGVTQPVKNPNSLSIYFAFNYFLSI